MSEVNIDVIEPWIKELWDRGASDLLITAGSRPLIRVDGELTPIQRADALDGDAIAALVAHILPEEAHQEFKRHHEVDFSFSWGDVTRFRGNAFTQRGTPSIALRVIPFYIPSFEELGLPPVLEWFCHKAQGLVLFTGPTGSGKSTTLASLVDLVNQRRQAHIITIEDPVEFVHTSKRALINQREVGDDTDGFNIALTQALRQDPDVVLVGEMRDLETVSTAISAAETGHLVFATLHTQDSGQTVDRIVDVFPAEQQSQVRTQLANTLQGIVAQQLVPTADGQRRVPATEVLIATPALRALIRDGKVHQIANTISSGRKHGMQTLDDSLAQLVRSGDITAALFTAHLHETGAAAEALGRTASSVFAVLKETLDSGSKERSARVTGSDACPSMVTPKPMHRSKN
mgnify:CR=1 FL=1